MPLPRLSGLWLQIAIPVLAFVALGSLVIVGWFQSATERESRTLFATLASTNGKLIRSSGLPLDAATAADFSRALGMQVFFRRKTWDITMGRDMAARPSAELVPTPTGELADNVAVLYRITPEEGIGYAGRRFQVIAVPLDDAATLLLARRIERAGGLLLDPGTLLVLALFWVLSVGLAWAIARGVVRPLRQLTEYLPQLATDSRTLPPGAERQDELGQLARSFLETRDLLRDERSRRAQSERLALLGRMATGLAHEIHNPLAAIRLHAQLLDSANDHEFAATARETLPVLLDETGRIEALVNQWMFLAKPVPPQTSRADLSTLVDRVARNHHAIAGHAGVTISTKLEPELWAEVDSRRITQAIRNVIMNAIQAMPTGGTLTITAGRQGGNVRIVFADTGPGFSPGALVRYTELFYSEKEGGMGIGLSVSSEILKAHRGVLTVANGSDRGAVVTFLIPSVP
jgi:signal transduction histidine kinase